MHFFRASLESAKSKPLNSEYWVNGFLTLLKRVSSGFKAISQMRRDILALLILCVTLQAVWSITLNDAIDASLDLADFADYGLDVD